MKRIILHELLKHMLSKASVGWLADTTRFPSYYMAFLHVYTGIECCQRQLLTAEFLHSFKDSKILKEIPSDVQGISLSFRNAFIKNNPDPPNRNQPQLQPQHQPQPQTQPQP